LHGTAGSTVRVVYDNRYVANITLQLWRARNTPLVRALCAVAALTLVHHRLLWHWVHGHSGHIGNEQADLLALAGREGHSLCGPFAIGTRPSAS
ncbi:MAG: RNase H family protein, partial [Candidatus Fonsibacter sp.]